MKCPTCNAPTSVTETRIAPVIGASIAMRRRRRCMARSCSWRGTTYEMLVDELGGGVALVPQSVAALVRKLVAASLGVTS